MPLPASKSATFPLLPPPFMSLPASQSASYPLFSPLPLCHCQPAGQPRFLSSPPPFMSLPASQPRFVSYLPSLYVTVSMPASFSLLSPLPLSHCQPASQPASLVSSSLSPPFMSLPASQPRSLSSLSSLYVPASQPASLAFSPLSHPFMSLPTSLVSSPLSPSQPASFPLLSPLLLCPCQAASQPRDFSSLPQPASLVVSLLSPPSMSLSACQPLFISSVPSLYGLRSSQPRFSPLSPPFISLSPAYLIPSSVGSPSLISYPVHSFLSEGDYPPWNQRYDAESQSQNEDIWLYGNDNCPTRTYPGYNPYKFTNALSKYATHVTIYIGNEYIRVTNDRGYDRESCHRCWYALNGQNDSTGSENTDIFVALNRVVTNKSDRRGYGVCAATLSWVCGWNFSENYKD